MRRRRPGFQHRQRQRDRPDAERRTFDSHPCRRCGKPVYVGVDAVEVARDEWLCGPCAGAPIDTAESWGDIRSFPTGGHRMSEGRTPYISTDPEWAKSEEGTIHARVTTCPACGHREVARIIATSPKWRTCSPAAPHGSVVLVSLTSEHDAMAFLAAVCRLPDWAASTGTSGDRHEQGEGEAVDRRA